jgi:L-ascorbate metabolism protein UlaG (beta-lactamase superfamily)
MGGPLTCEALGGLVPTAYRCGPVYGIRLEIAGISLYHQGSADLDDEQLRRDPVDIFLAGVAGREVTPRYWERVLPKLDPRFIVPTHYDDFFAPLGSPERFVRKVDLAGLHGEIAAASSSATLSALKRIDAA